MASKPLISIVAGARPNFMKIAPIVRALDRVADRFDYRIVHTGQHYDKEMSDVFFEDLGIPKPHHHLGAGGGSHADQTARIMVAYEALCERERPDLVLVVGDVNSTLACSIVAKKLKIDVGHVEAGLRSGDMGMPEEVNRVVTDAISDLFFVTEPSGMENLAREGKRPEQLHFVGHVMIDNLFYELERVGDGSEVTRTLRAALGARFAVVTLHRPSNVDEPEVLGGIIGALNEIAQSLPLLFPVHPRTRQSMERHGIVASPAIRLTGPLGYRDFLGVWKDARVVLTDSGGLQEETTALGIPCVTIRENTERPVTITEGTNVLAGRDPARILAAARQALDAPRGEPRRPQWWDGHAAERIVGILSERYGA